ncbi:serine hydrolase domain-containing protein [Hyphomonas oceanitis]|uniref:serine hydrolase domain-containing protein n=1 Tax=Hyphomonas oceanitis TaxID=81033 RepID=UPI00300305B1
MRQPAHYLKGLAASLLIVGAAACAAGPAGAPPEQVALAPQAAAEPAPAPADKTFDALEASASGKGFTSAGLAALDTAMAAAVDDGAVKGISTLLVKDGHVAHYYEHGIMRAADQAPIKEDTIFRIYSMSKPITGVALMTLYEQGAFSLDDPITKFVPEFADLKVLNGVDADGKMIVEDMDHVPTMRELMSHTAGFGYGLGGDDPVNTAFRKQGVLASPDLDTYISKVAGIPLMFQPGSDWSYSTSVDIQGYIVQKISGKPFGEYLQDTIFTPLGMTDTAFFVPESKRDRFSDVFTHNPDNGDLVPLDDPGFAYREGAFGMEAGGHGLVSTLADYARFCQMLVDGGELNGTRILKPETVTLMRTNVLPETFHLFSDGNSVNPERAGHGFGLDFGVLVDPAPTGTLMPTGTYYWGGAAGTWFWIDPVNDLFFIGMVQVFPAGSMDNAFRKESGDLVYEALDQ